MKNRSAPSTWRKKQHTMGLNVRILPHTSSIPKILQILTILLLTAFSIACSRVSRQLLAEQKIDLHQQKAYLWMPQSPLPIEQSVTLRLQLPAEVIPQLSVVEGLNMYMGKIPVQWQAKNGEWHAQLLIGACTEPRMDWQLTIPLEHQRDDFPNTFMVRFSSEAN